MGTYTHHAYDGTIAALPIQDKHVNITGQMEFPMPVVVAARVIQHMRPVSLGKFAVLTQQQNLYFVKSVFRV